MKEQDPCSGKPKDQGEHRKKCKAHKYSTPAHHWSIPKNHFLAACGSNRANQGKKTGKNAHGKKQVPE